MNFPQITSLVYILEVAIGIGVAILIHELGHLLMAKRMGVRVERFSIGFGPKLLGFKRGETEYVIAPILFGGYIKMAGEHPEERPPEPGDFFAKKPLPRSLVVVAGAAMNALLGVFLFVIAYNLGVQFVAPEIGEVQLFGPAWRAGLAKGDRIIEAGGHKEVDFEEISMLVALSDAQKGLPLRVSRNGTQFQTLLHPAYSKELGFQQTGFDAAYSTVIAGVVKDSPAHKAGLLPGDKIVALGGVAIQTWDDLNRAIRENPGKTLSLAVLRGKRNLSMPVQVAAFRAYGIGVESQAHPPVKDVLEGSPAEKAGIAPGDVIFAVDGKEVLNWEDLNREIGGLPGKERTLLLERDGETREVKIAPVEDPSDGKGKIGISFVLAPVVGRVLEGSSASKAGILPGDLILEVAGRKVSSWSELEFLASHRPNDEPIKLVYKRGEETQPVEVRPEPVPGLERAFAGIEPRQKMVLQKYPFWKAVPLGLRKAWVSAEQIYVFLRGMAERRVSPKTMSGPVGIVWISYKVAELGFTRLLHFLAIININFAILNLLPIPILDGGLLLFFLIEKLKGSPVRKRYMEIAQYVGLALLLSLVVYVTYLDVFHRILGLL